MKNIKETLIRNRKIIVSSLIGLIIGMIIGATIGLNFGSRMGYMRDGYEGRGYGHMKGMMNYERGMNSKGMMGVDSRYGYDRGYTVPGNYKRSPEAPGNDIVDIQNDNAPSQTDTLPTVSPTGTPISIN